MIFFIPSATGKMQTAKYVTVMQAGHEEAEYLLKQMVRTCYGPLQGKLLASRFKIDEKNARSKKRKQPTVKIVNDTVTNFIKNYW